MPRAPGRACRSRRSRPSQPLGDGERRPRALQHVGPGDRLGGAARRRRSTAGPGTRRGHAHRHELDRRRRGRGSRSAPRARPRTPRAALGPRPRTVELVGLAAVAHVVGGLELGVARPASRATAARRPRPGVAGRRSPPSTVRCASARRSAAARPSALSTPRRARARGSGRMPSSSAIAAACSGPAPPKASSAKCARVDAALDGHHAQRADHLGVRRRARCPRRTPARRGRARRPAAPTARAGRARVERDPPASGRPGSRRPSTRLASVTVGSVAAAAVARPGPGRRPRERGPTRSAPPASRQAIEPPPAPTVWMSTIGSASGRPPTSRVGRLADAAALDDADVARRAAHVEAEEVAARRSGRRAARPPRRRPRGRESTVSAACAAASPSVGQAAAGLHDRRARAGPRRAARVAQRGAGSGRAAARARRRPRSSRRARTRGTCRRPRARARRGRPRRSRSAVADRALVLGMAVGVQQADRDGLGLGGRDGVGERVDGPRASRSDAVGRRPLGRGERAARAARAARGAPRTGGRARARAWRPSSTTSVKPSVATARSARPCPRAARWSRPSCRARTPSTSPARRPRRSSTARRGHDAPRLVVAGSSAPSR